MHFVEPNIFVIHKITDSYFQQCNFLIEFKLIMSLTNYDAVSNESLKQC